MRVYTLHRRDRGLFGGTDLVLVKEGFSWPAFLFGPLWALSRGMWLVAPALLALVAAADAAGRGVGLPSPARMALTLGVAFFIGCEANDWRRRSLAMKGYDEVGVVAGRGHEEAEWRATQVLGASP